MKHVLSLVSAVAIASTASAQIYASDNFSYNGALTSNGWSAHSGAGNKVINANGSYATLDFSSGSGEDVNLPFTSGALGASDDVYASFTLNVPSGNPVNPDGNGSYCAHFKDSGFGFRGRFGLLSPAGSGDFTVAINTSSANLGAGGVWATDLSFDTNYTIIISYDAATGDSNLWVDPTSVSSTSVTANGSAGTLIETVCLRQSNDHTGFIYISELVAGNTFGDVLPVPSGGATATPFGAGCYDSAASFYEELDPIAMDLAGQTISGFDNGLGYTVTTNPGTIVPLGAGAVNCNLNDDEEAPFGTLGLWVGSNGWVALGGGNNTFYGAGLGGMLNNPSTGFYAWNDLQTATGGGGGDIYYEENGTVATVTWDGVWGWNTTQGNTFQITYDTASKNFTITFDTVSSLNSRDWVIGYSPGGSNLNDGGVDYTAGAFSTFVSADQFALQMTSNTPVLASNWDLTCDNMESVAPGAFFLFGSTAINPGVDLGVIGAPGCSAYTNNDLGFSAFAPGTGSATLSLPMPSNAVFLGQSVTVQAAAPSTQNAFGIATSNGITGVLGL